MKMTQDRLNRLTEVLSVPTHSRNEKLMIEYLQKVLTEKSYEHYTDTHGNIYAKKGISKNFPCFIAHTDTVHPVNLKLKVIQTEGFNGETTLTGIDNESGEASGIGGDDKCGVYLALEMLDTLPNVKVAFFVSEEIGCKGSMYADPKFFEDVGYVIQYDSPGGNSMSLTLMGRYLFKQKSQFADKVSGLIKEHGITDWAYHPYTDVWQIMEKFNVACLNLAAGYYRYHTNNEYVVVDDVQNGFELGLKLVEELGENKYENPKENKINPTWKSSVEYKPKKKIVKKLLLEKEKDKNVEDKDDIFNNGEYVYRDKKENDFYEKNFWDEDYDW